MKKKFVAPFRHAGKFVEASEIHGQRLAA